MRGLRLPNGRRVILSDTVGFISDLPHELVAAFRATLEEVLEADVILHIRDAAHDETDAQKRDVEDVLAELGIEASDERPIIEVLNKIDLLDPEEQEGLLSHNGRKSAVAISAINGSGVPDLLARIEGALGKSEVHFRLTLDPSDGAGLAWAHSHGRVTARKDRANALVLSVSADPQDADRFRHRYGGKLKLEQGTHPTH
jgi:GTP-binding protein HflX